MRILKSAIYHTSVVKQHATHASEDGRLSEEIELGNWMSRRATYGIFQHPRDRERSGLPTRMSVKEVIQPQVPLRLPCYDFAPVTALAFGRLIP